MLQTPRYHFTIVHQSDLLASIDIWEPAQQGIFEKGHFHSYFEILIFKKDGGTQKMGNKIFNVEDCSIHLLANNVFHELRRNT